MMKSPSHVLNVRRKFKLSRNFKENEKIQHDDKPFESQKKFNLKRNMKEHEKIKHDEKSYECTCCQKKFNLSRNLKRA